MNKESSTEADQESIGRVDSQQLQSIIDEEEPSTPEETAKAMAELEKKKQEKEKQALLEK